MFTLKFIQPWQQQVASEIRRRRQLQHTADLILSAGQQTAALIQIAQGRPGIFQKAFTFGRQAQTAGGTGWPLPPTCPSPAPPPTGCPGPPPGQTTASHRNAASSASIIKKILKESALLAGFILQRNSQSSVPSKSLSVRSRTCPSLLPPSPPSSPKLASRTPSNSTCERYWNRPAPRPVAVNTTCIRIWPTHWRST